MIFKNLIIYRLNKPITLTSDELNEAVAAAKFQPCGPQDVARTGFVSPLGRRGELFVHTAGQCHMFALQREEKILPAAVIAERVREKVNEIEDIQMRRVGRKEKDGIKDEVLNELLPKAFSKTSVTYGYLDLKNNFLVVDAASPKKADEFTSELRKALTSLPIRMLTTKQMPADVMTQWLRGSSPVPDKYELMDTVEMQEPGESGKVKCSGMDLRSEEVVAHVNNGFRVAKIGVTYADRIQATLCDDLTIRSIKIVDIAALECLEEAEDAAARFDSEFTLMTGEFEVLIPAVLDALGGEQLDGLLGGTTEST